jgi:hypothetical protein
MMALLHFPGVPALFVCHGALPWQEMPPRFPRIHRYVAVDDPTRERVRADGAIEEGRIVQILNFVDLERFPSRPPLPARPKRALAFSNRASEATFLPVLRAACQAHDIEIDVAGVDSGRSTPHPEALLPGYDLVFAKGRAALEAMAVGCAVVLCDARGLGPLVTPANFDRLRRLNFGFRTLDRPHDPVLVADEIARYEAPDATQVAARVRAEAGIEEAIARYTALYAEILSAGRDAAAGDAHSELRAAALYLRQVRATFAPPPGPSGDELTWLRAERDAWHNTAAWRWRQWLLEHPTLQAIYARLRQRPRFRA